MNSETKNIIPDTERKECGLENIDYEKIYNEIMLEHGNKNRKEV